MNEWDETTEEALFRRRTRKTFDQLNDEDWRFHRAPAVSKYTIMRMSKEELESYLAGIGGYDLEQTCRAFGIPLNCGERGKRRRMTVEEMRGMLKAVLIAKEGV